MAIRQSHVEQDDVHSTFRVMNHGVTHTQEVCQFEAPWSLLTENAVKQLSIIRVVLTQKNLERFFFMSVLLTC
jgi:hypothetical protein